VKGFAQKVSIEKSHFTEEPKTPGTGRFAFGSQAIICVCRELFSTLFRHNHAISCTETLQIATRERTD
jgi:hypothetical protein